LRLLLLLSSLLLFFRFRWRPFLSSSSSFARMAYTSKLWIKQGGTGFTCKKLQNPPWAHASSL
jgi:hypothetical protein